VCAQTCPPEQKVVPTPKVQLRKIVFRNAILLSNEERHQISKTLWNTNPGGIRINEELGCPDEKLSASDLADEAGERVRAAYQDKGYFKVEVRDKAVPVAQGQYDLVITVVHQGVQYRLGNLNFVNTTSFPEPLLRDLFPVQRGEIFSREKVAKGLEEVRRLYGSQGYLNFVSVPNTAFDDENALANLTIDVDEGKQFRLRTVDVIGVDPETKERVLNELAMKPGDLYTSESWESVFRIISRPCPESKP
jgi:outer membrane protein insertion porin family